MGPFSNRARAVLAALPAGPVGPLLFPNDGGARPASGFGQAEARLDRALVGRRLGHALPPRMVHDLRRSMATHVERIGVAPLIIEVCLGRVLKGVAGTYRQYGTCPRRPRPCSAGRTSRWRPLGTPAEQRGRGGAGRAWNRRSGMIP